MKQRKNVAGEFLTFLKDGIEETRIEWLTQSVAHKTMPVFLTHPQPDISQQLPEHIEKDVGDVIPLAAFQNFKAVTV
ncbi:hypothetical protein ABRQ07_15255 [Pectobacterium polonicum]|uniref:Uncharacterized protein n=1 Tax=Pectobacterium polonicum TaxID=2485124 RepID=A0ABV1PD08_9GAMM|nr:hypothetical protein [Pectobacterium polonicum]MDC9819939.1 hypothetical protein [Pectobacterium polonicum]